MKTSNCNASWREDTEEVRFCHEPRYCILPFPNDHKIHTDGHITWTDES